MGVQYGIGRVLWFVMVAKLHTLFGSFLVTASAALEGLEPPRTPRGGRHEADPAWVRVALACCRRPPGLALQPLVAPWYYELLDCAGRALVVIAGRRACGATGTARGSSAA